MIQQQFGPAAGQQKAAVERSGQRDRHRLFHPVGGEFVKPHHVVGNLPAEENPQCFGADRRKNGSHHPLPVAAHFPYGFPFVIEFRLYIEICRQMAVSPEVKGDPVDFAGGGKFGCEPMFPAVGGTDPAACFIVEIAVAGLGWHMDGEKAVGSEPGARFADQVGRCARAGAQGGRKKSGKEEWSVHGIYPQLASCGFQKFK